MPASRLAALLLASTIPAGAMAAPITDAAIPAPVAAHALAPVAAVPAGMRLDISVSLPVRDAAGRDALLRSLYDPASPLYKHYLSVADYTSRFGPSAQDYAAAARFFAAQGLDVRADAANRTLIELSGRAADIARVFHVRLNFYRHPSENRLFFAPDRVPTADAGVTLLDVIGLDDYVRPTPRLIRPAALPMGPHATGSGPGGDFIGSDFRTAYYGSGPLTGAGQSVGLMELSGYNLASVQKYFSTVGQPLNVAVVGVQTDNQPLSCKGSCDDSEQALDIEYAISMAPGLAQVQVYVGSNAEDVLNRQASDNTSKLLSTSWGWTEHYATDDLLFKEMAIQGQSNFTASGDYSSLKASGPWPEEDAHIIAVGGTDLVTDGAGGAWRRETGWNGSAGGPSVDQRIAIEPYQLPYVTTANGGSTTLRNVPDVAAQANINMFYCANGGCGTAGGTSFASPMFAAFTALANQQAVNTGHALAGFINPLIYAQGMSAQYSAYFHDETKGKSGKFLCTPSFDLVTGLGSPNAGLITLLSSN